ncbi:hypothetical protein [Inquilinus sp. OTU3971]|uniref:hypothetical protein n=1 Tax=Inquilinus sp. OTU3971 TaxID=3043855 RepID=UPI00313F288F
MMQTKPTASPPVGTASVFRTVALPGGVTMDLTVTAEALADGTVGDGTVFTWVFDSWPVAMNDDGTFFDAWEVALGEALDAALGAIAFSHPHHTERSSPT